MTDGAEAVDNAEEKGRAVWLSIQRGQKCVDQVAETFIYGLFGSFTIILYL